ncbi:MAG TPA: matrixin family metalloprotease, partial [Anaerolineae bacterium]|nr:matrixin family metalloprotease [Anaerolineae bacterium]
MTRRRLTAMLLTACALMLALLALPGTALATVEELSLEELVNRATRIVRGTVIDTSAQWNADHSRIYTYVTLRPIEYVKGTARVGDVVFAVPGGTVGELTLLVSDVPVFREGEETVVFLRDEYFQVVGWRQGKYTVEQGVVVETGQSRESFIGEISRVGRRSEAASSERGVGLRSLRRVADAGAYPEEATIRTQQILAVPSISGIVPNWGPAHALELGSSDCAADSTSITINGSSFGDTQGGSYVRFWRSGSTYRNACIDSWSNTQIEARVPGDVSSGDVQVVTGGGPSSGVHFTVTYSYGGAKWPGGAYPEPMSEVYEVNANCPDTVGELAAVQAAANTWSNVSNSDFYFRYGGTTSATGVAANGYNEIMWVADTGGSIAACHTWCYTSDLNTIVEFDIEFDDGYLWDTDGGAGKMDVQNIATHELGHALQLLDLYGTVDKEKTMYGFSAYGETKRRTLDADDIAGMRYIYPCLATGTPSGPSPVDNATGVSVNADLDWANTSHATSYDVYFGTASNPPLHGNTTSSSYPLPPLSYGTHYHWKVVAKNDCGSTASPIWDFTTQCLTAGMPSGPAPADNATGVSVNADLDWGNAANATSYDVYFGTSSSPPYYDSTASSSYSLPPLSYGTHYYWKVVAKNSCGQSTSGPVWDFTTQCLTAGMPSGPTPPDSATGVSVNADLDWANASNATSYDVYFGTASNPPLDGNTTSSSYPLPPLSYGTHYYWKVVAKNACGSTAGPIWDFTTECLLPPAPTLSSPSDGSYTGDPTPGFTWSSASGAVSYRIQVDNDS